MSLEASIPSSTESQVEYLETLRQEIIDAAGDQAATAEAALNRVFEAYAYSGTEYRQAADAIIEETGGFLKRIAPGPGVLLSRLGKEILQGRIRGIAIQHFLESKDIAFFSEVPEEDLPFYKLIQKSEGIDLSEEKEAIVGWLLGLTETDPEEAARIVDEIEKESPDQKLKEALLRIFTALFTGNDSQEADLDLLKEYGNRRGIMSSVERTEFGVKVLNAISQAIQQRDAKDNHSD